VRAQLTRIYAKAGITSQTGLIALFMEELIDRPSRWARKAPMADIALMHHLLIALGIGLLIGAERSGAGPAPGLCRAAFLTIASLMGCASALTPWNWMSGVVLACITALALFSNWQRRASGDPGITTEIALIATTLLGALSVSAPALAGASAVLITIILAARDPLHRFVGQMVTADEVADVLLISGATLIVLPMLPDRPMGPFAALNPMPSGWWSS
jgi:hypothetical protein